LVLLAIQTGTIKQVMRLKLLFRCLLIGTVLTGLNITGFLLAERRTGYMWEMLTGWMVITWLYLFFWMAVTYLVLSVRKKALVSALYLAGAWLLLLIIIPSLINTYVQAKYPLPLQDEIAAYRRHQSEEIWSTPPKILADSFNRYNPQYASSINAAKDTLALSIRYVAGYYDLLERRMNNKLAVYEQQVRQRNQIAQQLLRWNPAFISEYALNTLSGNHLGSYFDFAKQANEYQKEWQAFLYAFHFSEKRLQPADFSRIPDLTYRPLSIDNSNYLTVIVYVLMLSCILFIAGVVIEQRHVF
jgi:ABC-2 type transport system permease protein